MATNNMITGFHLIVIRQIIKVHMFLIVLWHQRSVSKTLQTIRHLKSQIKKYLGSRSMQKFAKVDGKYYWDMYGEGWPSAGFKRNVIRECNRINANPDEHVGMRNILFGITTKCPLRCEHCYEWDILNIKEKLTSHQLNQSIEKILDYGAGQIHFGGGEPMMRLDDMISLISRFHDKTGFWIVTSGFNVTDENAHRLKMAGLTGMCVSIDHADPELHNRFRQREDAFDMAITALKAAQKAKLVTALSICVTREFISESNLRKYIALAKQYSVSFIQLLEPQPVGHYAGKEVMLTQANKNLLQNIFLNSNTHSEFKNDPIIIYHEYYKETLGCRGAGNGALYIDPLGEVQACPFCKKSVGNIINDSLATCVEKLRQSGCALPPIKKKVAEREAELVTT